MGRNKFFQRKFSTNPKDENKYSEPSNSVARRRRFSSKKWAKFRARNPSTMEYRPTAENSDSDHEEVWMVIDNVDKESKQFEKDSEVVPCDEKNSRTITKTLAKMSSHQSPVKFSEIPLPVSSQNSQLTLPTEPTGLSLRQWHDTRLGDDIKRDNYKLHSDDFMFTILSYNVLSDKLAQMHPELYIGKRDEDISWELRWPRLLEEVFGLGCDIVCFQEVDSDHFVSHFEPAFKERGFSGIYKKRTNDKNDGCAIFFNDSQVELLEWTSVEYFQPEVETLDRDNVAILAKFRPRKRASFSKFCVATTHLLFNPRRHDVKLAQVALLLAELDRFAFAGIQHGSPDYHPCIVTGDFNLTPDTPVYNFMESGTINFGGMLRNLQTFGFGKRLTNFLFPQQLGVTDYCQHIDVAVDRVNNRTRLQHTEHDNAGVRNRALPPNTGHIFGSGCLYHSFGFRSAYKQFPLGRAVTSNTDKGYGNVDYIFYSTVASTVLGKWIEGNLKLLSRLNLFSGEEVSNLGGLPSRAFPSDHISLVARFLLKGTRGRRN